MRRRAVLVPVLAGHGLTNLVRCLWQAPNKRRFFQQIAGVWRA